MFYIHKILFENGMFTRGETITERRYRLIAQRQVLITELRLLGGLLLV